MNPIITPLEAGVEVHISEPGTYQVQLEVPRDSALSARDIRRILDIASWRGGSIDDKVDGYEGGRAVLITREKSRLQAGLPFSGLELSGVGYRPFVIVGSVGVQEENAKMRPPSTDNFMHVILKNKPDSSVMRTTDFKDGQELVEQKAYTPTGAYLESRAWHKVCSTREVGELGIPHITTPEVEAWGRYVNLMQADQHLAFAVFTIPSVVLRRFTTSVVASSYVRCARDFESMLGTLGRGLRVLHDKGYVHRQVHAGNFYVLLNSGHVHLMDWSTLVRKDQYPNADDWLRHRAEELYKPIPDFCTLARLFHAEPQLKISRTSAHLIGVALHSYLGNRVNPFAELRPGMTDNELIYQVVKKQLG